jgi:hypothetical protein
MYFKVLIKSVSVNDESICTELSLPYFITREQRRDLTDDIEGVHTNLVVPHLTGKLYSIGMSLVSQRMSSPRRKSLDEYYSFLCELHDMCTENAGFIYVV